MHVLDVCIQSPPTITSCFVITAQNVSTSCGGLCTIWNVVTGSQSQSGCRAMTSPAALQQAASRHNNVAKCVREESCPLSSAAPDLLLFSLKPVCCGWLSLTTEHPSCRFFGSSHLTGASGVKSKKSHNLCGVIEESDLPAKHFGPHLLSLQRVQSHCCHAGLLGHCATVQLFHEDCRIFFTSHVQTIVVYVSLSPRRDT